MALVGRAISRIRAPPCRLPVAQRRHFIVDSPRPQVYISTTLDPHVNLSIEHHLLQKSHPDSTVLFLYRNRPSVVIGRNQNPWLEVNLNLLRRGLPAPAAGHARQPVRLVRRRSGGGTVFHDEGNANWAVLCPPAAFDRDRHAEMVARALRRLGVRGARVNERHDIVRDDDDDASGGGARKVSGSAYKLTRLRSLHHGTCLLGSPNLAHVSALLRSPAEPYIKARGVESVRSPIGNVGVEYVDFVEAVKREFGEMYGDVGRDGGEIGVDALDLPEIRKGVDELQSDAWTFGQTPMFTFSTCSSEEDPRPRPDLPSFLPPDLRVSFTARHGVISKAHVSGVDYQESVDEVSQDRELSDFLINRTIYNIADWRETIKIGSLVQIHTDSVGQWLNSLLGCDEVH